MLIVIKSAPDTPEGRRGITLAKDLAADVCLIQNAVYFARNGKPGDISGAVYVLGEDCRMRGLEEGAVAQGIQEVGYDEIVDMMISADKVIGAL
jgi:sulfur relay protein TusB/DsrH